MAEVRAYREKLYAKYATLQVPNWLQTTDKGLKINNGAIARRLRGWLPAAKDVSCLDLGCGAGDLLLALRSMGFTNVAGVDGGPEQVRIAKSRNLDVVQGDIVDFLSKTERTFDLIFAFDVIEHFTKDEVLDLLALIHTRLSPGGRLILQTPNAISPWASHYRYGDLTHELIFSPECLATTLRMSDLIPIGIREVAPYPHGLVSSVRWLLWKLIWASYAARNYIESGSSYGGVYTRNMLICAVKER